MPKLPYNPAEYSLVAERITEFYQRFPEGRIITHLVSNDDRSVVFRSEIFRRSEDLNPSATGWASEREGDGLINLVACLENCETSAIGRALANLGFTASKKRASLEEMEKVERAGRSVKQSERVYAPGEMHKVNDLTADVMLLLFDAKEAAVPYDILYEFRNKVESGVASVEELTAMERQLRHWTTNGYSPTAVNTSPQ